MFKSGYITIIGKPNVGKSTLTNALVGEKVSIVSFRPQTTRDRILGIVNGKDYQMMLVDTPGIHKPKNKLSEYMMKNVETSIECVDGIVYVIACDKKLEEDEIKDIEKYASSNIPLIIVINKCDTQDQEGIIAKIDKLKDIKNVAAIIPISALKKKHIQDLEKELVKLLPEGEKQFSEDEFTDKSTRFIVSEYIREKALKALGDELPYGVAVIINTFEEGDNNVVTIEADIVCEKQAHKAIIIGKNASKIKEISQSARIDIEKLLGQKVFLRIFVKVKEDWRNNPTLLNNMGYDKKEL
ncbi:MAG: GTPase Era [Clostridiales bacterium]|nr:GTPase Era [Clostridiales bacterium]